MILLCYPRCSTCAKAQKWLDDHNITYTYRDIKLDQPSEEELRLWHSLSNKELKSFYNTSGMIYRQNNLKERIKELSIDKQYQLLASDGMLVKRPLVIDGDTVLIGFKEKEWEAHFLK